MEQIDHRFLSTQELGTLLGVTRQTIRNWIKKGEVRAFHIGQNLKIPVQETVRILTFYGLPVPNGLLQGDASMLEDIPDSPTQYDNSSLDKQACPSGNQRLESGMNDCISKPIRKDNVFQIARKWVLSEESTMNMEEMATNLGLESGEYYELVGVFIEATTSDLAKLESALSAGKVEEVVEAAHSIKGAAGSLGFDEAQALAKKIEMNARENILEGSLEAAGAIKKTLNVICRTLEAGGDHGTG